MERGLDVDALRERAILSSLAGFPFLLVFGCVWTAAGALTYVLPADLAPWAYPMLGVPGMGVAMALERRMGYVPPTAADPLVPLALQVLFVQIVAFPAILLVWSLAPPYMPVAFAAVVGAHVLPFQWIYRTPVYGWLGVVVAVGPYVLALVAGREALHYTGFLVGPALLAGAVAVRAHARATWRRSRDGGRSTS